MAKHQDNKPRHRERGIALIAVLLTLLVLSSLVASFLSTTSTTATSTGILAARTRLAAAADGAVHAAIARLAGGSASETLGETALTWTEKTEAIDLSITVQNTAGLIDLNRSDAALLMDFFLTAGADAKQATALADQILDYRDGDDLIRPSGAEDRDYRAAGLPFGAADRPFAAIAELQRLPAMTPALYQSVKDAVTLHGRRRPIATVAPLLVRTALGVAAAEDILPPPQQVNRGRFRIRVTARNTDGAVFTRQAIVNLSVGVNTPPTFLTWETIFIER